MTAIAQGVLIADVCIADWIVLRRAATQIVQAHDRGRLLPRRVRLQLAALVTASTVATMAATAFALTYPQQ
ncbi:hypothetical protein [Catenulispora pinisilvae]|uniref:hypothetical protein n=1 Tax=Catenulispora pinisilvae TaxID=2705253 RepID=UPI001890F17F|nr:hypothetical protein [Catenulispora pinisilvae]